MSGGARRFRGGGRRSGRTRPARFRFWRTRSAAGRRRRWRVAAATPAHGRRGPSATRPQARGPDRAYDGVGLQESAIRTDRSEMPRALGIPERIAQREAGAHILHVKDARGSRGDGLRLVGAELEVTAGLRVNQRSAHRFVSRRVAHLRRGVRRTRGVLSPVEREIDAAEFEAMRLNRPQRSAGSTVKYPQGAPRVAAPGEGSVSAAPTGRRKLRAASVETMRVAATLLSRSRRAAAVR